MAIRNSLIVGMAAGLLLTGCSPAAQNETTSEMSSASHEQAIRSIASNWIELIRKRDAAAIAQNYTEDGALMPPGAPLAEGRPAIERAWRGMMATPGFDLTFEPTKIVVSVAGDMAMDRGTYRFSSSGPDGPVTDTGKYVVVWRNVDGNWKAAADIFNSDGPAAGQPS
jgi:uncharacterized protein (TIGR02246 family)